MTSQQERGGGLVEQRWAMRLSLGTGVAMLVGKVTAYLLTGSSAILADAAESVIHVAAVAFALFSVELSARPADRRFRYGYERIAFFSAGFEGAMIALAAAWIIITAVRQWLAGIALQRLGLGTLLVAAAAVLNLALGLYLLRTGRRTGSLILEANGKHVLTDSWTSFGVIGGLVLVMVTGWLPFDPLVAIAVALNILWSAGALIRRSVAGLMDYVDPRIARRLEAHVEEVCRENAVGYHGLRFRHTGHRVMMEVHLLFPYDTPVGEAHRLATRVEQDLAKRLPFDLEVTTHLEAVEDHERVHGAPSH